MSTLHSSSDLYSSRQVQQARSRKLLYQNININNYYHVDQPSAVAVLFITRTLNELLVDAVDHWNYRLIKKSARYDDFVAEKLGKKKRKPPCR